MIEYRGDLSSGSPWIFPDGPHNSGLLNDTNITAQRFYRLRITEQQ